MVSCCLVLHNMGVSDRVMLGDVRNRYDPDSVVEEVEEEQEEDDESGDHEVGLMVPTTGVNDGAGLPLLQVATTTIRAFDTELAKVITQRQEIIVKRRMPKMFRILPRWLRYFFLK